EACKNGMVKRTGPLGNHAERCALRAEQQLPARYRTAWIIDDAFDGNRLAMNARESAWCSEPRHCGVIDGNGGRRVESAIPVARVATSGSEIIRAGPQRLSHLFDGKIRMAAEDERCNATDMGSRHARATQAKVVRDHIIE